MQLARLCGLRESKRNQNNNQSHTIEKHRLWFRDAVLGGMHHPIAMAIRGPTKNYEEIRAWADTQGMIPANLEPNRVDAEPACMCLLHKMTVEETAFAKEMVWEEFS